MTAIVCPLKDIFSEQMGLAWDILESEANLQVFPSVDGRQIANLLSHYMRAVQVLNSVQDRREEYFKAKMASLMLRPTVVKSINRQDFKSRTKNQQENPENEPVQRIVTTDMHNRRQQMAVQLAYHNDKNSKQELIRLMTVEYSRSGKLKQKIADIIKTNEKKIQDRIRHRRIRALELREERYQMEAACSSEDEVTTVEEVSQENSMGKKDRTRLPSKITCEDDIQI